MRRHLGVIAVFAFVVGAGQALAADAAAGKVTYGKFCVSCHGPGGKGDGPAAAKLKTRPRDHTDCAAMKALSDDSMKEIIEKGGKAVGKSSEMPPWGKAITPAQLDDVIAYVRSLCAK